MSYLNIFEKALLEGVTSKESDILISMNYIYNIPSSPGATTQMNPGKFLPVLQGYNPNGGNPTDRLVPLCYDNTGSISFDTTKTLYMFSIKEFDTTESNLFNNTFLLDSGISDDLIFDSNANVYSYQAYEAAWVSQFPNIPASIIQQDMDTIVNSIKNNNNYFNYFNTLLKYQPTPVYNIDHSKDTNSISQTLYTQITPAKPGDRENETVNNIEIIYEQAFNNFNYLPSDLSVYPIYIPSMFFQYFLYKASASSADNWHIIYNPVHRQHYNDYWMSQNVDPGTPNVSTTTNMHMINYGNIFKTTNNNGSYFIDPVCTCVTPFLLLYPNTSLTTKPSYAGPYISHTNPINNPPINISDNYALYTTLSQGNIYNYDPINNVTLPRSFYNSNKANTIIETCKSSCSNNIASQINTLEQYTYTKPLINLTYYRNSNTTSNIIEDMLPLWGKMSFINYVNGRSYSTNTGNAANTENTQCNPTSINITVCSTAVEGAGNINFTNNASLQTLCGGGGGGNPGQPVDGNPGSDSLPNGGNASYIAGGPGKVPGGPGKVPSKNNTTIIIIIIIILILVISLFSIGFYIINQSK